MIGTIRKVLGLSGLTHRSAARFKPQFDPLKYTQGRWLDRDQERRNARSLQFNFDALLDVAVRCSPGAQRVVNCEKKEGGFNRVFMIHFDNDNTVVARLPTRIAGPPGLTLSSEVATLQYVKTHTSIPVPRVLSWNAEAQNDVGTEYMILEAVPGIPLKDVWSKMTASQHIDCIRSISLLCRQICKLEFPAYGSLYLKTNAPAKAVDLDGTFCVGSLCSPQQWDCSIENSTGTSAKPEHQGPWSNIGDYFSDLVARAKSRLQLSPSKDSKSHHLELLDLLDKTLGLLSTIDTVKDASGPTLFHSDLHTRNIFVDPEDHTKVTGIIDWQSAAIEPAFVFAAESPDFAEELDDEEGNVPSTDLTDEERTANERLRLDVDFCVKAWAMMQFTFQKIRPATQLNPALLRALAAPSFGWTDKSLALEALLHGLEKQWKELELPAQSPFQPHHHAAGFEQRLDEYDAQRRLQVWLSRQLRCDHDGWVPNDRWEEVLPVYRDAYEKFVQAAIESEECTTEDQRVRAVETANRIWPFDQR